MGLIGAYQYPGAIFHFQLQALISGHIIGFILTKATDAPSAIFSNRAVFPYIETGDPVPGKEFITELNGVEANIYAILCDIGIQAHDADGQYG